MTRQQERPLVNMDNNYFRVHEWIIRIYGNASYCSNNPDHVNRRFEWANISGVYEKDIKHFIQLCMSCHRKMDIRPSTRLKMSKTRTGRPVYYNRRKVGQFLEDGTLVKRYEAIMYAAQATGILKTSIINNLVGRSKSAGGYIWRYL